jgi:hypothetical protein
MAEIETAGDPRSSLATGRLHVRRANTAHRVSTMQGDEIGACNASKGRLRTSFMTERDGPMTPKAFHALFGLGLGPSCNSRYIHTCCDTAAATPWRTRATTHRR